MERRSGERGTSSLSSGNSTVSSGNGDDPLKLNGFPSGLRFNTNIATSLIKPQIQCTQCNRRSAVVARVTKLEKENVNSAASLMVSLLAAAAITSSCPPALSADVAKCSLTTVQANGYEYAYPESWIRDRIRGIEVLAHDPEISELNMSIFTGPAQSGTLSGSATEIGEAIMTQYQKSPSIEKAELLEVDMKQDGTTNNRSYSIELSIEAGGKQRHLLTKLIRTDRKVLSLTLQVPEELWVSNESCMKSIVQNFKQTTIV